MTHRTFRGLPCPVFIKEYVLNGHKYPGIATAVYEHLHECATCRREYARINERIRQWEENDIPGFRG